MNIERVLAGARIFVAPFRLGNAAQTAIYEAVTLALAESEAQIDNPEGWGYAVARNKYQAFLRGALLAEGVHKRLEKNFPAAFGQFNLWICKER